MSNASEQAIRAAAAIIDTIAADLDAARLALEAARDAQADAGAALPPAAYTTGQVAQLLGLSRSTVAQMIRTNALPSVKIGGSRRVLRAELDRYLASLEASS
jgi:excisionase family DNA binding protein